MIKHVTHRLSTEPCTNFQECFLLGRGSCWGRGWETHAFMLWLHHWALIVLDSLITLILLITVLVDIVGVPLSPQVANANTGMGGKDLLWWKEREKEMGQIADSRVLGLCLTLLSWNNKPWCGVVALDTHLPPGSLGPPCHSRQVFSWITSACFLRVPSSNS